MNFWVLSQIVYHHGEKVCHCISSSDEKSLKFINNFMIRIEKLLIVIYLFVDKSLDDICTASFWSIHNFFSSLFDDLHGFLSHQANVFFTLPYLARQTQLPCNLTDKDHQGSYTQCSSFRNSFNKKIIVFYTFYLVFNLVSPKETY